MTKKNIQQLRVEIDSDLHRRMKILAAKEGTTLKALAIEAFELILEQKTVVPKGD